MFVPLEGLGEWLGGIGKGLRAKRAITVSHVRYVKQPAVDPVAKAIAMAKSMGRTDLVERLER